MTDRIRSKILGVLYGLYIGGIVGIPPIVAFYYKQSGTAKDAALEHLALTHPGLKIENAALPVIEILLKVLNGTPPKEAIVHESENQNTASLSHPIIKWLDDPDVWIIGPRFRTVCYVEHSIPVAACSIYFMLNYQLRYRWGFDWLRSADRIL